MEELEQISYNFKRKESLIVMSRIVSAIFTPFMVPLVAFFLLFFFTYLKIMPLQYKLIILGMIYCFTVLMPMFSIFIFQKINGLGIKGLSIRKNRFVPYALTILSYVACLITMYRMHLPRYLSGIIVATLICMILCSIINFKWKISTHVASSGMMVGGLLSYSFIFSFNPIWWLSFFIILTGLLGTARMILGQHTLIEVIVGFVVGFFCGIIGILFI